MVTLLLPKIYNVSKKERKTRERENTVTLIFCKQEHIILLPKAPESSALGMLAVYREWVNSGPKNWN